MASTSSLSVVVAGGGIGGLSLGCFLGEARDIDCQVIERAQDVSRSTAGAGIGLWINSLQCFSQLDGVLESLQAEGLPMPAPGYVDGATGAMLAKPSARFGERFPVLSLHRDHIMRTLADYLEKRRERGNFNTRLTTGTQVVHYFEHADGVDVHLSDDNVIRCDILVGADGIHSRIRQQMLAEAGYPREIKPLFVGYSYFRAIVAMDQPEDSATRWHDASFEAWHDGHRFGYVPLKPPHVFWFLAIDSSQLPCVGTRTDQPATRGSISDETKQALEDIVCRWSAPVNLHALVKRAQAHDIIRTDIHKIPEVTAFPWRSASGRVVLLGDAAHATAPNIAQGAGLSIEDAAVLAAELAAVADHAKNWPGSLNIAIGRYEALRKPRALTVQTVADIIARAGQVRAPLAVSLRNVFMRTGTRLLPRLEAALFETGVSISLGGGMSRDHWYPPGLVGPLNPAMNEPVAGDASLMRRLLGESLLATLPAHVRAFKTSPCGGEGHGQVSIERGGSWLARLAGDLAGFPHAMERQPFLARVINDSVRDTQRWTRVFAAGTPMQKIYSTTHDVRVTPWNGFLTAPGTTSAVLTEGIGGALDRWIRFAYRVTVASDGQRIDHQSVGVLLGGIRLPLPTGMLPRSEWQECATGDGWTFDGQIRLPGIGRLMRYHGQFHIDKNVPLPSSGLRIVISGGTGLVGRTLCATLVNQGHEVIILTRDPHSPAARKLVQSLVPRVRLAQWNGRTASGWSELVNEQTVLINLAGENPGARRWSAAMRKDILDSRLSAIAAMADAIQTAVAAGRAPRAFLQASAAGIYGNRGDECLAETAPICSPGTSAWTASSTDFRVATCIALEDAASRAVAGTRTRAVMLRVGHVFGDGGGILPYLEMASRLRVGRMGSGQQYVPWVHVVDVARAIEMIVRASDGDPLGCGAVNVAGPSPATNADVMRALAVARKRIGCRIVVPQQPMEMILGESACVIFDSERLLPGKLKSAGFEFLHETVLSALAADPYA